MDNQSASPIIVQTDQRPKFNLPNLGSVSLPKIIFFVLMGIIVIELIWGAWYLLQPLPAQRLNVAILDDQVATVKLVTPKDEVTVGQIFEVNIIVSTAGQTSNGTDIVLRYDPNVIAPVEEEFFKQGKIYAEYLGVNLNNSKGVFRVSGISGINGAGFSGEGSFGVMKFRAIASGQALLSLDYERGETADTNVINSKTTNDLLVSVSNLEVSVR